MVKNKSLEEGEYDGSSSRNKSVALEKQKTHYDMLDFQDVEEVSSVNNPSPMSMVEKLMIRPTLALI